jgi:uncharacterized protein (DUF1330 family)/uncharacterized protein YjiS (DUF1127 family)
MSEDGFDQQPHDIRTLATPQWNALKRSAIGQARDGRNRAIRQIFAASFAALRNAWRHNHAWWQARAALYAMTDRDLRDIGLVRGEIDAAIHPDAPARAGIVQHFSGRPAKPGVLRMTKAYWIVRVSVRDQQRYPDYLAAARPAFEKFGANFIVRGGAFEAMEGVARDRNVVVEFADRATATACYQSPEYQAAKSIRQQCADADFIIAEGAAA